MFYRCSVLSLFLLLFIRASSGQTIQRLNTGSSASLRGVSAVNDRVIWVSGSNGTVLKTVDGGNNWQAKLVKGYEKRDFRDIEAFDSNTAVIMAVSEPAQILKTTDGGNTWRVVFTDTAQGMFLDAMDFRDNKNGIVVGDPLPGSGHVFVALTTDNGDTWNAASSLDMFPPVEKGEAMFAASGSNVIFLRSTSTDTGNSYYVVTGGTRSSLLSNKAPQKISLPLIQGHESTGANSIAAVNSKEFIVVGGNFARDTVAEENCVFTRNGGGTFIHPATPPHGYRSCVAFISKKRVIACGTSGVDISIDGGMHWKLISAQGFHVCAKAKTGRTIFLAGSNGRFGKLVWK